MATVSTPASSSLNHAPKKELLPRILIIGAGSQGHAYAEPITRLKLGHIVAVCEPIPFKRQDFGRKYIWGPENRVPLPHEEFGDWKEFIAYEKRRRESLEGGEVQPGDDEYEGVDAVFICLLDELHIHVVKGLAPLGLHIMCEKPLATSLDDCIDILGTLRKGWQILGKKSIFGIGHVLRYSPHNMLLRKLVREERVVGDIISIEHTEPIGWWHMSHSFVRGNWRRQDMTAPSLLTKSCHDIDFLMWLLCSPTSPNSRSVPHLPSFISSTGHLNQFRKARKPLAAGSATNCFSCPIEPTCLYSAKKIYVDKLLDPENLDWPLKSITPDIEDLYNIGGKLVAEKRLLEVLAEDYTTETQDAEIKQRAWYGRCVWECDNDVCDDQIVTMTWEDDRLPTTKDVDSGNFEERGGLYGAKSEEVGELNERGAKTAIFHMIAPTEKICERRGKVYGTTGEITYDSDTITVYTFADDKTVKHATRVAGKGHGGGDESMAENFCRAVQAVISGGAEVEEAQRKWLGCQIEEIVRSHVAVFAAENARNERMVVRWKDFWKKEVEGRLCNSL